MEPGGMNDDEEKIRLWIRVLGWEDRYWLFEIMKFKMRRARVGRRADADRCQQVCAVMARESP
jgi:hypothetical protein